MLYLMTFTTDVNNHGKELELKDESDGEGT